MTNPFLSIRRITLRKTLQRALIFFIFILIALPVCCFGQAKGQPAERLSSRVLVLYKQRDADHPGVIQYLSEFIQKAGFAYDKMDVEKLLTQKTRPDLSGLTRLDRKLAELSKIEAFRKLKESAQQANKAWKDAESGVASLAAKIKQAENPTRAMTQEFNRAKQQAASLKAEFLRQQQSLNDLRLTLQNAGINTAKLSSEQKRLKASLAESRAEATKAARINVAKGCLMSTHIHEPVVRLTG